MNTTISLPSDLVAAVMASLVTSLYEAREDNEILSRELADATVELMEQGCGYPCDGCDCGLADEDEHDGCPVDGDGCCTDFSCGLGDDAADELAEFVAAGPGKAHMPKVYGEYADAQGDVWRHNADGWQVVETVDGINVEHLTFPCEWDTEGGAHEFGPYTLLSAESHDGPKEPFTLAEAAEILNERGCDTGRNRLFSWLRMRGWTKEGTNEPTFMVSGDPAMLVTLEGPREGRAAVVGVTQAGIDKIAAEMGGE